nr:PH domain-containing protein [Kibdelosporangium sp. MJ126-NF4]CEL20139.1 transmembrane protein, distant homology with ydbT [Kibdelosporangium sp. MJ126-NF4]CTQ97364.1 transmembrane protein, distant homology with ydbT [Kibdelosporangium sp. MJ126-NF4]
MNTEESVWQRLDRRVVWSNGAWIVALLIATLAVMWWRDAAWWLPASACGVALAVVGYEGFRWFKTRYRVSGDMLELTTGVLVRSHRSIPRQRIRSVDVTANPLHRIFGIATVRIGTGHRLGTSAKAVLTLDAVAVPEADRMRTGLILRSHTSDATTIATGDWRWIRYAPLSIWVAALGGGAIGVVYKALDTIGANPDKELIPALFRWLSGVPLAPVLIVTVVGTLLVGVVGALGLSVEMWWNFRLTRESGGALRAARGLFVTRSVTLEEERLRGVEVAEPLLLRWGGGAYTYAVATGAGTVEEENSVYNTSALLPPAPIGEAHRVAAEVLREEQAPTKSVRLVAHTTLARGRRLRWAMLIATGAVGALALLGALTTTVLLHVAWMSALVLYPAGVLFALDAYRNLGHGLTGRYLVTRHGTLKRRTIALRRDGLLGWKVDQWAFHRRSGLCTLTAITAGGRGGYPVKDVIMTDGMAFADEAVPGVLGQFLVRA